MATERLYGAQQFRFDPDSEAVFVTSGLQQDLIGNVNTGPSNRTRGFVFGKNANVDNVRVDLWEGPTGTYVFPAAAQQMAVVSSSANDAAAGTGVHSVYIHYLDTNYAVQYEIVTLNGTTPVLTAATNILRINGLHSTGVGSAGVAVGNISLTNTAGTVTYGYLSAGQNTARQAIYTVQAGVTGYITHWQCSSGSAAGNHFTQISLLATTHDSLLWPGVFLLQDEQGTQDGGMVVNLSTPIPIPAMADVKLSAISDGGSANVTALGAIMGYFEDIAA